MSTIYYSKHWFSVKCRNSILTCKTGSLGEKEDLALKPKSPDFIKPMTSIVSVDTLSDR